MPFSLTDKWNPVQVFRSGALATAMLLATGATAQESSRSITIVLAQEPANLELCNGSSSDVMQVLSQNVGEALTKIDVVTGEIVPQLATSWEQVGDTTWRFTLREGVMFTDGTPFNAEAAAAAVNRTLSADLDCTTRANYFAEIKVSAQAAGEYTLDLTTDQPVPVLPAYMAWLLMTSSNTPMTMNGAPPVGTGPYMFESQQSGQDIVFTRNDAWWQPAPPVETVRYVWRAESSVRAAMVAVGEADLAPEITVQDATDEDTDVSYQNSETAYVRIDMTKPPLNDRRVRQALYLAVDKEAMRGTVFSKDVVPATNVVVEGIAGYNPDIAGWPHDPDKARQLLEEASADGVPVDREIQFIGRTNFWPNNSEPLEALQAMWNAVGFNMNVQMLEPDLWRDYYFRPYPVDAGPTVLAGRHNNQSGDVVLSLPGRFACGASSSAMCMESLDRKMEEASTLPVGPERIKAWQEVARAEYEDVIGNIMLFHLAGYSRVAPRINYTPDFLTNSAVVVSTITFN